MSGYPPEQPRILQPYPSYFGPESLPPPPPYSPIRPSVPYPAQVPYPSSSPYPVSNMSNPGYPNPGYLNSGAGGYQVSPGYPGSGDPSGYPGSSGGNQGGYPGPTGGTTSPPGFNLQVCPDLSQIEKIPGYEHLTFDEAVITPPTAPQWQPDTVERKQIDNIPTLTEEDVREAAIQYASENCCYSKNPAKDMSITNIQMMSAFHYKLETFGEKRESAWRFEPYRGQAIDGPMNGPAPQAWDIMVTPPTYFMNGKTKMEVPHTAFVKPCHTCVGNCRVRCEDCQGNGRKQCTWCNGRGFRSNFNNEQCNSCNGTGFDNCTWCNGTGQKTCKTCNGKGQLKGFVELIVTWTNHVDDYISETSKMPKELVKSVSGETAFEEENLRVSPIMHSSVQAVNNASVEFCNRHNTSFTNERIIKQRQCLRIIPIGEVSYSWKEKLGQFYVYGYEHKVYFIDYPQKCCCCTIL